MGKIMYIRTTHKKLASSLLKSPYWKETQRSNKVSPSQIGKNWNTNQNRTPYSFQYIKNDIIKQKSAFITNKPMTIFDLKE